MCAHRERTGETEQVSAHSPYLCTPCYRHQAQPTGTHHCTGLPGSISQPHPLSCWIECGTTPVTIPACAHLLHACCWVGGGYGQWAQGFDDFCYQGTAADELTIAQCHSSTMGPGRDAMALVYGDPPSFKTMPAGLPTKIVWLGGSVSMNIAAPSPDTSWVAMWHRCDMPAHAALWTLSQAADEDRTKAPAKLCPTALPLLVPPGAMQVDGSGLYVLRRCGESQVLITGVPPCFRTMLCTKHGMFSCALPRATPRSCPWHPTQPGQDPKAPLHQALNVQHYLEHKRLCNSSSVEMDNMAVFASTVEFMELCQFQVRWWRGACQGLSHSAWSGELIHRLVSTRTTWGGSWSSASSR